MSDWILVEKALPEPETTVLVTTVHKHPETKENIYWVFFAFYENGKILMGDSDFDWDYDDDVKGILEYNKKADDYYAPKGWYESVFFSERFSPIEDDFSVIAWMPVPKPYKPTNEDSSPPELGAIEI